MAKLSIKKIDEKINDSTASRPVPVPVPVCLSACACACLPLRVPLPVHQCMCACACLFSCASAATCTHAHPVSVAAVERGSSVGGAVNPHGTEEDSGFYGLPHSLFSSPAFLGASMHLGTTFQMKAKYDALVHLV